MDSFESCEKVRFRVVLHRPGSSVEQEAKTSEISEEDESFVYVESSNKLSSLASKFLQRLYEQGKVEDNDILKASNVKVLIQVRPSWKPLPLSTFVHKQSQSDQSLETVFGPLLQINDSEMVVHLHLCTEKIWTDESVREAVKQLLQSYSQTHLERLNCPFSQGMLSQISRDQYYCKVSAEKIHLFGQWYNAMMLSKPDETDDNEDTLSKRSSCVMQRSKKIVFSKEELPLLRASFSALPHPSTERMTELAKELNKTEFRKMHGRKKVDFCHVNNWFKNERSRVRKGNQGFSQVAYRTAYSMLGSGTENDGVLLAIKKSDDSEVVSPVSAYSMLGSATEDDGVLVAIKKSDEVVSPVSRYSMLGSGTEDDGVLLAIKKSDESEVVSPIPAYNMLGSGTEDDGVLLAIKKSDESEVVSPVPAYNMLGSATEDNGVLLAIKKSEEVVNPVS